MAYFLVHPVPVFFRRKEEIIVCMRNFTLRKLGSEYCQNQLYFVILLLGTGVFLPTRPSYINMWPQRRNT